MAKTIEELNFKLKIDNGEFDKQIQDAKKEAQSLNMELSRLLEMRKASGNLTQKEYLSLKRLDNLESNRRINADKEAVSAARRAKAVDGMANSQRRYNEELVSQNRLLGEAKNLALSYVSIWGAQKLLSELVNVTAEFELQRTTLRAMLQDARGADVIYEQIKGLAVVSPFNFKELVTYTKQLAAYSVPIGELYDTTKMLADVSAGLGVDLSRLILAYGQVRSAAFLRGQEVRQFTEAGIPILEMLAKQFSELEGRAVSAGEVFDKISKRLVPFEMVAKVFKDLTSEGGKFYQMQEIQAETLKGKLSNLKDAYQIMFAEIGEKMQPVMKGAVDDLRKLANNYDKIGKTILVLAVNYGIVRSATLAYQVALGTLAAKQLPVIHQLRNLAAWALKNPYVMIAAGAATLAGVIYKVVTAQTFAEKAMERVTKAAEKFNATNADDAINLEFLLNRIKAAAEGTREYESAKKALFSQYGEYISKIDEENIALGKTAEAYENILVAVRNANREKALSEGLTSISKVFGDANDDIFSKFRNTLEAIGEETTGAVAKQLGKYIRGEVDENALTKEARDVIARVRKKIDDENFERGSRGRGPVYNIANIDAMRDEFLKAAEVAKEARYSLAEKMDVIFGPEQINETSTALADWANKVNSTLAKFKGKEGYAGLIPAFSAKDTSVLMEYVADLAKSRKEAIASMQIENGLYDEGYERSKKQVEVIDAIDAALGGVIAKYEALNGKSGKTVVGDDKDAVRALQDRISLLERMKEVYETLKPYFNEGMINNFFGQNFAFADKSLWENFDFDKQIQNLVTQLESLGDAGKRAADVMREKFATSLSKDVVEAARTAAKELEAIQKRLDGYVEAVRTPAEKIAALNQKMNEELGFAGDDETAKSAVIKYYTAEMAKLHEELVGITSIQLTDFWRELTGSKDGTYGNLTRLQRKAEELRDALKGIQPNTKDGKITGYTLTKAEHGDILKTLGIDAESVNLTVAQVEMLNRELEKLFNARVQRNGIFALVDQLSQKGGFKNLWEQIKSGEGGGLNVLKGLSSQMTSLGGAMTELGKATGSSVLQGIGEAFGYIGGVTDKLLNGDLFGAVQSLLTPFTEWADKARQLQRAISEAADEAERLNAEARMTYGVDTLWGENVIAKIRNATDVMKDYASAYAKIGRDFSTKTITWRSGLFGWGSSSKSLQYALSEMGYELYDLEGRINTQGLQKILDTYEELFDADRRWIENAIRNADIYNEAVEKLNETISDTWGSIADDMADKLIAARNEVGDAYHALAGDLQQTFGDMAQDIAHQLVSSFIVDNILSSYTNDLKDLYGMIASGRGSDEIASAFATMAKSIEEDAGIAAQFTNQLYNAFEGAGFDFSASSEKLSEGIKGITEDTANLLASYLNAVRADVATGNMQRNEILSVLRGITVMPNIDDYLNRIQANTYDTAQNTRDLLLDIRSMMTTETGQVALRVLS